MTIRLHPGRALIRTATVLGAAAILHAAVACGSDTSTTGSTPGVDGSIGGFPFVSSGGGSGGTGAGGFGLGGLGAGGFGLGGLGAGGLGAGGLATGGLGAGGGLTTGGAGTVDGGPDADAGDAPVCTPPATPLDTSALPRCADKGPAGCTDGVCFTTALVPESARGLLADCDADNKCIPEFFVQQANQFTPQTCESVNGAEGRCLSLCIPQVSDQAGILPKADCADTERCAPCFDPRTGVDTGACSQGCDTGPTQPPKTFDKCCTNRGSCVPDSIVPTEDAAQLGTDTCTGEGFLCAPDKLSDTTYKPPRCSSIAGLEGRCLPDCIPAVAEQKDRLRRATCDEGDLCAPCYDPITGNDTGACTRGDDVPTDPPVIFPTCCGSLGHCVPDNILSTDQKAQLGPDSCTKTGDLCAPDVFAAAGARPEACRSLGTFNAEGRCIPACVPSVAEQADRLTRGTCDADYLCAPCFDPVTGADTGACKQNGDTPAEPPKTFTNCCGNKGSCVPTALVPLADRSQLGKDTCTASAVLCVPDKLADAAFVPKKCDSIAGAEGRCLADCLPAVAEQASRLQRDVCDAGELCAPCYDPITGTDTGACTRGDDEPTEPPFTFPACCHDDGHCVPKSILSTEQQALLGKDSCAGANDVCAPDVFADPSAVPDTCRSLGTFNAEGRCIPDCVPSVADQADRLSRATCAAGELCAPCWDPITGADTGACRQNGDTPKETKKVFAACCGTLGLCVPTALVPADQAGQLGRDSCGAGNLCAPKALTDPDVQPTSCRAPGDIEARCLPACLPPIQAQAQNLRRQTCGAGELCAPCFNPLDGTDTGACRLNGDTPKEPKEVFAGCCPFNATPRGTCVPPELVTPAQATSLPQDSCQTGRLCAPNLKVQDQSAKFPACSYAALQTAACLFLPCNGGCVPDCIVAADQRGFLARQTCAAGELCAPCDVLGTSSGACD